jgi:hypothetical protein
LTTEGLVRVAASTTTLECQAGRHTQGDGLPVEHARGSGVPAVRRALCSASERLCRRPHHHRHERSRGGGLQGSDEGHLSDERKGQSHQHRGPTH